MIIDKILLQNEEPRFKGVLWADPIENGIALKLYNNGKWHVVGGSGGGCNCSNVSIKYVYNEEEGTDVYSLEEGNFEDSYSEIMAGKNPNITVYEWGYNNSTGFTFITKDIITSFGAKDNQIYLNIPNGGELIWDSEGVRPASPSAPDF